MAVVLKTPGSRLAGAARAWPDWLGVAGGFSFAVTNILLRRLRAAPGESRVLAMFGGGALVAGGAALAGTALGAIARRRRCAAPAGWAGPLLLGAGFVWSPTSACSTAPRGCAASATALIMLSEVLFASVSSVALGAAHAWTRASGSAAR